MNTPPPRLASLPEIEAAVWRELGRATVDRHHAWRTPVLATVAADGSADARTIVLRECDALASELRLYTDARSAKVRQLQRAPLGTLAMWSPRLGWQLRLRVHLTLQVDGLAVASRWARLKNSPAAQDYLSPLPPGSLMDAPGSLMDAPGSLMDAPGSPMVAPGSLMDAPGSPLQNLDAVATPEAAQASPTAAPAMQREHPPERGHFALLTAQVQAIDWLELHALGHRRASFDAQGARWRVP